MPRPIDVPLSTDQKTDLVKMLQEKFLLVQKARMNQLDDKAKKWEKNYAGIPTQEVRSTPFYRASNFMPQLIRMHSDILTARVLGIIMSTRPFWVPKTLMDNVIPHEMVDSLGAWMNFVSTGELCLPVTIDSIMRRAFRQGTVVMKSIWDTKEYSSLNNDGSFKESAKDGLCIYPVPFEDFWPYPITAPCTYEAEILYHRLRFTERDVKERQKSGKWNKEAAEFMFPSTQDSRPNDWESSGITVTPDVSYPYTAIEAWLQYPVGGKNRPIVCVFNPQVAGINSILKLYFNFMPEGCAPFIDFQPMPRDDFFYGYSVPEILEQSQEEQAQIHNARRDANLIANVPGWKKKRYADVPNPSNAWYPGCVIELDEMDDLDAITFPMKYDSMIDEEQFIMSLAERYVGISPAMQGFGAGQSAGKRGIYATGATLALLSEGNQRLDIYIRRLRYPFHRLGKLIYQSYKMFRPLGYEQYGELGQQLQQAFALPESDYLLFDIGASDAAANRETDRQNLLLMANTMAQYYTQIWQAVQVLGTIPPDNPAREVLLGVLDGARDIAKRLLFSFDIGDRERILPDVRKITSGPPEQGGLSGIEGTVQPSELQSLLQGIGAVTGGNNGEGGY